MGYAEQIGKRIRKIREERDITQADLAKSAKVGANYIPRVERGELVPSLEVAHRIAQALGITLDELCSKPNARKSPVVSAAVLKRVQKTDAAVLKRLAEVLDELTR